METKNIFFFRHFKQGTVYNTPAVNSDVALIKCLKDTNWRMDQLVYEGKQTISPSLLESLNREETK